MPGAHKRVTRKGTVKFAPQGSAELDRVDPQFAHCISAENKRITVCKAINYASPDNVERLHTPQEKSSGTDN